MNRTRLLMIGALALALGAFVSLLVYKNMQGKGPSSNEPGADVVERAMGDDFPAGERGGESRSFPGDSGRAAFPERVDGLADGVRTRSNDHADAGSFF